MDPTEALRVDLAGARSLGLAFDDAWPQAVIRAAGTAGTPHQRGEWLSAFDSTRDAWERTYARLEGTAPERALTAAGDGLRPTRDYALEARRCEFCDRLIPTDVDPRARFCQDRPCRRQFKYERERQRAGHAPRVDPEPRWPDPAAGWDSARAARLCEHCATNWVPLDRDRFCSEWCESHARPAE